MQVLRDGYGELSYTPIGGLQGCGNNPGLVCAS